MPERVPFTVHVFGSNVTPEGVEEVGDAIVALYDAVAEAQGLPAGLVRMAGSAIACDGCDSRQAWEERGQHGWTTTDDGHDYCPACSHLVTSPSHTSRGPDA